MFNFLALVMLLVSYSDFITYDQAWKEHQKNQAPVITIITSDSCPHCVTMKKTLLEIKKEYPDFILAEISYQEAKKRFKLKSSSIPQTFMYAFDKEEEKIKTFKLVIGSTNKENLYKIWEMK